MPCRDYACRDPLSCLLALIPPNKRSLLPGGQEIPTVQALSSACSLFPMPLRSLEGSNSYPVSSARVGSQQRGTVAPSPARTGTLTHATQQPETGLELEAGARLPCLFPGWIPRFQLCRRMLHAGCWGRSGGAGLGLQGHLGHGETHHFCKPLGTGDSRNPTLCNRWVTVEFLRGCLGWYARSELTGEHSTGDGRSTAAWTMQ